MMRISRRTLLVAGAATFGGVLEAYTRRAAESGVDAGVQLYMARALLARDFEGGLAAIAGTGVKEVEFAGLHGRTAEDVRRILDRVGLRAVGAHCVRADMSDADLRRAIDECRTIGARYVISAAPLLRELKLPITSREQVTAALRAITIEDVRYSAAQFNRFAATIKAAGLEFGYHSHGFEFQKYGTTTGFDEMLRLLDPATSTIELDLGNLVAAGADPAHYLRTYPGRFRLAHVKDWRAPLVPDPLQIPPSAPFGRGAIDWPPLVAAAKSSGVQHFFIEQEELPQDQVVGAIADSHRYLKSI